MPRPTKSQSYSIQMFALLRKFETADISYVELMGRDIATRNPQPDLRKRCEKLRFDFYAFKSALEKEGNPLAKVAQRLEFVIRGEGEEVALVIQPRDTNDSSMAIERALERQGISLFGMPQGGAYGLEAAARAQIAFGGGASTQEAAAKAREQQWLKEGVEQTKKFEKIMEDLGFVAAPKKDA